MILSHIRDGDTSIEHDSLRKKCHYSFMQKIDEKVVFLHKSDKSAFLTVCSTFCHVKLSGHRNITQELWIFVLWIFLKLARSLEYTKVNLLLEYISQLTSINFFKKYSDLISLKRHSRLLLGNGARANMVLFGKKCHCSFMQKIVEEKVSFLVQK